MPAETPLLVLIAGAPASGKTTLAHRLGPALGLPVLWRDGFKEVLMDALGVENVPRSRELGGASYQLLHAALGWLLDAGVGAIVESNFRRGWSEKEIRVHLGRSRGVLLHCQASRELLMRRYEERAGSGDRHPGHHDLARIAAHRAGQTADDWTVYEQPLDLDVPTLQIDTTDGYAPDFDEIVAFARSR